MDYIVCIYRKNGFCFSVHCDGNQLQVAPRPMLAGVSGTGHYICIGSSVYDGKGLLLGVLSEMIMIYCKCYKNLNVVLF